MRGEAGAVAVADVEWADAAVAMELLAAVAATSAVLAVAEEGSLRGNPETPGRKSDFVCLPSLTVDVKGMTTEV